MCVFSLWIFFFFNNNKRKEKGSWWVGISAPRMSGSWGNLGPARFSWERRRWREGQRAISSQLERRMRGRWIFRGTQASTESSSVVGHLGLATTSPCSDRLSALNKKGLWIFRIVPPQQGPRPTCSAEHRRRPSKLPDEASAGGFDGIFLSWILKHTLFGPL